MIPPSGTEPLADQSFSTTPTQLFGMNRSANQVRISSAKKTTPTPIATKKENITHLRMVARRRAGTAQGIRRGQQLHHQTGQQCPSIGQECPFKSWIDNTSC